VDSAGGQSPINLLLSLQCGFVLQRTIDILKIDIECSEWSALDAMLASPWCLSRVKQLMVNFHECGETKRQLVSYWRTLWQIDRLGFKLWRVWNNNACKFASSQFNGTLFYRCFNAYYINVYYII